MAKAVKDTQVTARISAEMKDSLTAAAEREDVSEAIIIRRALKKELKLK